MTFFPWNWDVLTCFLPGRKGRGQVEGDKLVAGASRPDLTGVLAAWSEECPNAHVIETRVKSEILATLRRKCATHSLALNQNRRAIREAVPVEKR